MCCHTVLLSRRLRTRHPTCPLSALPQRLPTGRKCTVPFESQTRDLCRANPLCYPLNTFQQKIISYIYFTSSGFREPTLPDKMSIWAIIHYDSSWHEYWRTWARTVMRNPHMALSGVLCSRPLLISNDKVTVSPSTCHKESTENLQKHETIKWFRTWIHVDIPNLHAIFFQLKYLLFSSHKIIVTPTAPN